MTLEKIKAKLNEFERVARDRFGPAGVKSTNIPALIKAVSVLVEACDRYYFQHGSEFAANALVEVENILEEP